MQERAKITKSKILDTAIKLFAELGFYGTRVDAVAEKARVNKQRIYAYYGNKNRLFEAALSHVFEEVAMFSPETESRALGNPDKLTEMVLEDFMTLHEKFPYFWRMLAWANLNNDISTESLLEIKASSSKVVEKAFELAQAKGLIKNNISYTTYIFNLMAVSFFYYANRKTLSKSFSGEIYTPAGQKALMGEIASLF